MLFASRDFSCSERNARLQADVLLARITPPTLRQREGERKVPPSFTAEPQATAGLAYPTALRCRIALAAFFSGAA
jgi:hypothetical protein